MRILTNSIIKSKIKTIPKYLGNSLNRVFNEVTNSKNPLQPSIQQVEKLQSMTKINTFLQNLTPYEWSKIMEPYKSLLFSGKTYNKIADQEFRADIIISYIKSNPQIKNIITMDGHGRFLLTLLQKLDLLANDIKIIIVDIDPIVNQWHKLFFPNSIDCIESNIFNFKPSNNTVVYMNFCGIGGKKGQEGLAEYLSKIESKTNYDLHMMISLSTARCAKGSCEWLDKESYDKLWLKPYKKTYIGKKISDGPLNNFPTYCLKFPKKYDA
jgi:hypothetical protein